ncbi:MAG: oxygenase MpaB family protein [Actinomycetota bacterium]|nr:oxygenase MpaB family protein [Actinomycetota bacterium]
MTATVRRADADGTALTDLDIRPYLDGLGAGLAGSANVIMQLALAPVGYGVLESKVESGQVTRHPIKRARTTFTYLAVALLGTDEDRTRYRKAVDGSHRLVRSDALNPVQYNAFDPGLQLWVAACLYFGTVDLHERMYGPPADPDALYRYCARFGTTLQVRPEMWPADRAAFAQYWERTVATLSIDESIRRYLYDLTALRHLPFVPRGVSQLNLWIATGFLPEPFREQMQLAWGPRDQQRFDALLRRLGTMQRRLPAAVRCLPFSVLLWDMRRRVRAGRALV